MSETDIVNSCLQVLQIYNIFAWRNNTGGFKTERGGFYKFGKAGSPDIIAVYGGQFIGIECKVPKGRQNKNQIQFQKELEEAGGWYWLITSNLELENLIKKYL